MDTVLSLVEIESRFPDEWVLVVDPVTDASLAVQSGMVRWHGKDRDEGYRRVAELKPRRFAMLFTGQIPEGMEVVL